MNTDLLQGTYIVAVSGGVDSVVLLDMLSKQAVLELVVAHFDHGIRDDSSEDRKFVAKLSQKYNLPFEYSKGNLGKSASEEQARKARYEFLQSIRKEYRADAIVTAHHQDDVLETMFINIIRGTKQKGLTSLTSNGDIVRPLLDRSKLEIKGYAKEHNLVWREDSTNSDTTYLRNWLRHHVLSKMTPNQKKQLLDAQQTAKVADAEIETLLDDLGAGKKRIDQKLLVAMAHKEACEFVVHWLRKNNVREFDKKTVERIVLGAKTLSPGKAVDINKGAKVRLENGQLVISTAL